MLMAVAVTKVASRRTVVTAGPGEEDDEPHTSLDKTFLITL
jgi:hypothetical protein